MHDLSGQPVPADLLTIRAPATDWFRWAILHPGQSQFVTVAGCRIHYLVWARAPVRPDERGLLFGAHSHWWSYIAPYFTRVTFASRRLICPAWATVAGERTTTLSFAPKKSESLLPLRNWASVLLSSATASAAL